LRLARGAQQLSRRAFASSAGRPQHMGMRAVNARMLAVRGSQSGFLGARARVPAGRVGEGCCGCIGVQRGAVRGPGKKAL
jgi:hypothetical protein